MHTGEKSKYRSNRSLLLIVSLPLLALLFFVAAAFNQGNPGFKMDKTQNGLLVSKVVSPLNPVQKGDLIVALHGVSYHRTLGFLLFPSEKIDEPTITLERNSTHFSIKVKTVPLTLALLLKLIWPRILLIIFFLTLALIAILRAPHSVQVNLFFLMLCSLSTSVAATLASSLGLLLPEVVSVSFLLLTIFNWLSFGAWLHFACRFPASCDLFPGKKWPIWTIYLLISLVPICLSLLAGGFSLPFWGWLQRFRNIFLPLIIVLAFCKHLWDYRHLALSQVKNQLKLPLVAYWLTFAPYFSLYLLPNLLVDHPLVSFRLVIFPFFILPLAYLVSLLRYRLFDVDRLLSRVIAFIVLVVFLGAFYSYFLVTLKRWLFGNQVLSEELFLVFLIIIALGFQPIINYVEQQINRIFFRHRPVPAEVLHHFSDKISASLFISDLIEVIVEELPAKINVRSIAVMLLEDNHFRLYPEGLIFGTSSWWDSALVNEFQVYSTIYLRTDQPGLVDELEQELLQIREAGFSLVLPMRTATGLSGLLLIGSRNDGRFFSKEDIHLMASLANQGAIALENAHRHESLVAGKEQIEELFMQRVQQEKLAVVGEMTATVAHELKNPLGIIHSSAQYLVDGKRSEEMQSEMLNYIIDEVEHLNISISSLLGLAGQSPPRFEQVDLAEELPILMQRWQQSSDHNPEVSIECRIDRYIPPLYCDFRQLSQVLLNLVRNSEEMMAGGGSVILQVERKEDRIVIKVKDDGSGINDKDKENIFNNFFTTKEKGLGLGLVVCRQIVNAHNGTIKLYNREGGGAVAHINLPLKPLVTSGLPGLED